MNRGRQPATADLDPDDWDAFSTLARRALDEMLSFLATLRERPVWTEPPSHVRARFGEPLPRNGSDIATVLDSFNSHIRPYAGGNLHPAFMGWVQGAGTPVGMLGEMLAAGLDMNCGGRNHIGLDVERQITTWMREAFGFPAGASGVFVTGTSAANFLALLVARDHALGSSIRRDGIRGEPQLCAYASVEAHGCVGQALELSGIGSRHLRRVPCDENRALDVDALETAIAADLAAGHRPFLVVGTAGTVDTGAIDPLRRIAEICRRHGLWFHVDGAFGSLAAFSPRLRPLVDGLSEADSVGFDFHKWAHVPYDAGFLLVRDGRAHRATFAAENGYLSRTPAGLAAGEIWPCDLGPDLSRGFRALKTWFTLKVFGTDRLGAVIEKNCALAQQLAFEVAALPQFEVIAPVRLNIVCFTVRGDDAGPVNRRIVEKLHLSGQAVPSITQLDGKPVIRCAINNHRTGIEDIADVVASLDNAYRTECHG